MEIHTHAAPNLAIWLWLKCHMDRRSQNQLPSYGFIAISWLARSCGFKPIWCIVTFVLLFTQLKLEGAMGVWASHPSAGDTRTSYWVLERIFHRRISHNFPHSELRKEELGGVVQICVHHTCVHRARVELNPKGRNVSTRIAKIWKTDVFHFCTTLLHTFINRRMWHFFGH